MFAGEKEPASHLELTPTQNNDSLGSSGEAYAGDEPSVGGSTEAYTAVGSVAAAEMNASLSPRNTFWKTFAGIVGNVLEWYDFAIFGFLSVRLFFVVCFFNGCPH